MSSTTYAKQKILNYNFGATPSYTPPANYYLALSTTSISSSGSNITEPVGASYARVQIPNDKSHFTYASASSLLISSQLDFVQSSGSWGTIVDCALMDGLSSGSAWFYTTLSSPLIVQINTIVSFSGCTIVISQT